MNIAQYEFSLRNAGCSIDTVHNCTDISLSQPNQENSSRKHFRCVLAARDTSNNRLAPSGRTLSHAPFLFKFTRIIHVALIRSFTVIVSMMQPTTESILPKWIFVIAKIFGYWPFPVAIGTATPSNSIRSNACDILWTLNAIILYIMSTYFYYKTATQLKFDEPSAQGIALTELSLSFVSIIAVLSALWRRKSIAKLIGIMRVVEREVIFVRNVHSVRFNNFIRMFFFSAVPGAGLHCIFF